MSLEIFLKGDVYYGNVKGMIPHGKGKYTWSDGTVYEGSWKKGKMTGGGKITWTSGTTYEGEFCGGYLDGFGTLTNPDGSTYIGSWRMNIQHGLGRKQYSNSDVYDGSWKEGVREGSGKYGWCNGDMYIGNWKGGLMCGRGVMKWLNSDLFDGYWLNGYRHGSGVYRFADGSYYFGTWTKGLKDGRGMFYPGGSIRCPSSKRLGKKKRSINRSLSDKISINGFFKELGRISSKRISTGGSVREFNTDILSYTSDEGESVDDDVGESVDDKSIVVCEREYIQGVLISERIKNNAGVLYKKEEQRKFHMKEVERKSSLDIFEGYKSSYLMLNLQLGIRYTVGKITPVPMREVRYSDFGEQSRIRMYFPRKGSQLTPPHSSIDFYWKDYCSMVFRNLREMFKLDAADYMMSICGDDGLRELSSQGKSGSLFYLSHDDRFVIKTLKKSELKVLLNMLPSYYKHVHAHDNTLITKFYGLHQITLRVGKKVQFVVMGNMFYTELQIHQRYDLKGSYHGRNTNKDDIEVQVGLQSPEGVTTTRTVSRRFNDFLRLLAALRKAFPKKNLPPAPPKGLLRLKSRTLLEERRCSLEEWMTKLLSDIDISRSIVVASFLELESAARSSFQDENPQIGESSATVSSSSPHIHPNESESTPDYNSDTAYDETSEIGTSRDNISEDLSLDEDLVGPLEKLVKHGVSNIDEGLLMGNAILDQVEGYSRNTNHSREINMKGSSSSSSEKNGDYVSEKFFNGNNEIIKESNDVKNLVLPLGQQQKMNRVVVSMKRRLGTAKTDMEDLISRLNQEIAVKDYLTTKVKDLEEELETTKVRSKENLHQAILMERERVTQMQWDMEELRRKSLEMEFKLKSQSQQDEKVEMKSVIEEKDELLQELEDTKSKLEQVSKKHQELEIKSKADVKILVKEVKSLRTSQAELKQQLNQSLIGKSEAEKLVQQEKERMEEEKAGRMKLLHECDVLQKRLKECSMNLVINGSSEDKLVICSPSVEDALQLVKISDDRMEALLAQAQMLAEDDSFDDGDNPTNNNNNKLRKILSEILVDNITLRRQVSLLFDGALKTGVITTTTTTTKDMEVSLDKS